MSLKGNILKEIFKDNKWVQIMNKVMTNNIIKPWGCRSRLQKLSSAREQQNIATKYWIKTRTKSNLMFLTLQNLQSTNLKHIMHNKITNDSIDDTILNINHYLQSYSRLISYLPQLCMINLSRGSLISSNYLAARYLMVQKCVTIAIDLYVLLYSFRIYFIFFARFLTLVPSSYIFQACINSVIRCIFQLQYSVQIYFKNQKYFCWFSTESFLINQNYPQAYTFEKSKSGKSFFLIQMLLHIQDVCLKVQLNKGQTILLIAFPSKIMLHVSRAL